jgi:hypothetical protein
MAEGGDLRVAEKIGHLLDADNLGGGPKIPDEWSKPPVASGGPSWPRALVGLLPADRTPPGAMTRLSMVRNPG